MLCEQILLTYSEKRDLYMVLNLLEFIHVPACNITIKAKYFTTGWQQLDNIIMVCSISTILFASAFKVIFSGASPMSSTTPQMAQWADIVATDENKTFKVGAAQLANERKMTGLFSVEDTAAGRATYLKHWVGAHSQAPRKTDGDDDEEAAERERGLWRSTVVSSLESCLECLLFQNKFNNKKRIILIKFRLLICDECNKLTKYVLL